MRKYVELGVLGIAAVAPSLSSEAKSVNFHAANQNLAFHTFPGGGYNDLMYGQGAAPDPGNNVWNGFGNYGGPGSTYFYGGSNPSSEHPPVPAGNPGNPYAYYKDGNNPGVSTSGNTLFVPSATPSTTPSANAWSDGTLSPITLNLSYTGETGVSALNNAATVTQQGAPNKILSESVLVGGGGAGTFELGNVPQGKYDLYLYGANYDNDRGANFSVTTAGDAGTPLGGFTAATNPGGGLGQAFVLGSNYVVFQGVSPDLSGTIAGVFAAISNPITGQTGEANFNGLQLVEVVPEPGSFALLGLGGLGVLLRRRRRRANE